MEKPISIRNVPDGLWKRFVRYCKKEGRSIPYMFIQMVTEFLKSKEK